MERALKEPLTPSRASPLNRSRRRRSAAVRLVHPDTEQARSAPEVDGGDDASACVRRDAVVLLRLGRLARLPAPPGLHPPNSTISSMIGFGNTNASATSAGEADEPHPRRQRRHRAAAVERHDRQQVEEVEEEAGERERREQVVAGRDRPPGSAPPRRGCRGPGPARPDPRLGERVAARATWPRSRRPGTG